jgi:hypothetical protein
MTNSYSTKGTPSLEQLTNTSVENPINNEAVLYEDGVWKNKAVLTPSSLPSGGSGDVIISDGSSGLSSTNRLNVNPTNGNITGTYLNVDNTTVKMTHDAGSGAGSDTISIGWNSGLSASNGAVSIGTQAGQNGGTNSVSLGFNAKAKDNNCIVINGSGTLTDSKQTDSCYISPVRDVDAKTLLNPHVVQYHETNKELIKSQNLHISDILCRNIDNQGTLTNVSTASLYNGQLTVGIGGNKIVAGAGNNNLVVDLTNQRVSINKAAPDEQLDINGTLRIEADTTQTIRFFDTQGGGTPDENGRIEVAQDGGGGEVKIYTLETGGGTPVERLSVNRRGALGLSGLYGTTGQVLTSQGSGSAVQWTTPFQPVYGSFRLDTSVGLNISVPEATTYPVADWTSFTIHPNPALRITNTGSVFSVPVDGTYNINLRLHVTCSPADSVLMHFISIRRNGTVMSVFRTSEATATAPEEPEWVTCPINTMLDILSTDAIDVTAFISTNGGTFRLLPTNNIYSELSFTKINDL